MMRGIAAWLLMLCVYAALIGLAVYHLAAAIDFELDKRMPPPTFYVEP